MLWLTWQIWILLTLAFAGGVITGWVARNKSDEAPEADHTDTARPVSHVAPVQADPQVEDEPVKTGAAAEPDTHSSLDAEPATEEETISAPPPPPDSGDDLTQIKGLGPRAAEKLKEAGVTKIAQIAAWTDEDVDRFDALINGRGRIIRDSWVQQAKDISG